MPKAKCDLVEGPFGPCSGDKGHSGPHTHRRLDLALAEIESGIKKLVSGVMFLVTEYQEGAPQYALGMALYDHLCNLHAVKERYDLDEVPF